MPEVRSCVVLWFASDGQLYERTEMIFGDDGSLIGCSTAPAIAPEQSLLLGPVPGRPAPQLFGPAIEQQLQLFSQRRGTPGGLSGDRQLSSNPPSVS